MLSTLPYKENYSLNSFFYIIITIGLKNTVLILLICKFNFFVLFIFITLNSILSGSNRGGKNQLFFSGIS